VAAPPGLTRAFRRAAVAVTDEAASVIGTGAIEGVSKVRMAPSVSPHSLAATTW
jgi:hypothetical protein